VEELRDKLEVKDDMEWKKLQPLISKISEIKLAIAFDRSSDSEALRRALEERVPISDLTAALGKLQEFRKTKQAELEKAQTTLREVVTVRQQAVLMLAKYL
jgi:hypothetical protein